MKPRIHHVALAVLAAITLSSCGAVNSVYQTAGRAVQAVQRTVTR